jgi:hypothetical protein
MTTTRMITRSMTKQYKQDIQDYLSKPIEKYKSKRIDYESDFTKTLNLSLFNKLDYINEIKTRLAEVESLPKKGKISKSFECMVLAKLFINYFIKTSNICYNFIATTYKKSIELRKDLLDSDIIYYDLDGNFILYYIKYLEEYTLFTKGLIDKYNIDETTGKIINGETTEQVK